MAKKKQISKKTKITNNQKNQEMAAVFPLLGSESKTEARTGQKNHSEDNKKIKTRALLLAQTVIAENSDGARELYSQSRFGEQKEDGVVQLSIIEAFYLMEKGKLAIISGKKEISRDQYLKKARKIDLNFWTRYSVYKDMRDRGYIVKTALKFGADFRVYDRGIKPGEDHAKWVVFPVHESTSLTWHEYAAKNRVAHSTKKRLMLAVVDDEGEVSYWESRWLRP